MKHSIVVLANNYQLCIYVAHSWIDFFSQTHQEQYIKVYYIINYLYIEWEEQRTRDPVIHFCQSYPAGYSGNKQILEVGTFFGAVTEQGCESVILYRNHETDVKYW